MRSIRTGLLMLVAWPVVVACAGGDVQPPPPAPTPTPATEPRPEQETLRMPEAEPPLEERWRAPFGVSTAGGVELREPREVHVLGADPEIAEGIAALRASSAAADDAGRPDSGTRTDENGAAPIDENPNDTLPATRDRPPEMVSRTHRVGPGDTLWGIARRFNVSPERIREVNGLSGDRVRVGETLVIPGEEDPS